MLISQCNLFQINYNQESLTIQGIQEIKFHEVVHGKIEISQNITIALSYCSYPG